MMPENTTNKIQIWRKGLQGVFSLHTHMHTRTHAHAHTLSTHTNTHIFTPHPSAVFLQSKHSQLWNEASAPTHS